MNRVSLVFAGKPAPLIAAAQQAGDAVQHMGDRAADASTRMAERFDYASSQSSILSGGIGDIGGALTTAFGDDTAIGQFGAKMEEASAIVTGFTGIMDLGIFATNNLKLAQISQSLATARATIATKAAAIAQRALNLAMRANPIGLIITAVAALIAIVIAIEKRTGWFSRAWRVAWDAIQGAAQRAWTYIQKIPGWTQRAFSRIASFISAPYRAAFNLIARAWNSTIGGLSFTVPGWVPGIGGKGFSVPTLRQFHSGGVVPGVRGTPTVALLQAGERVSAVGTGNGGGVVVIRGDGSRVADALVDLIATSVRSRGGRPAVLGIR